jgi:hypothetical protein
VNRVVRLMVGHANRGPVARAGVSIVMGIVGATVARTIGTDVIALGTVGSVVDAVWIGVAVALGCQLVLAMIAVVVPDSWRTTRQG